MRDNPLIHLLSSPIAVAGTVGALLLMLAAVVFNYLPLWLFLTIIVVVILGVILYVVIREVVVRRKDDGMRGQMDQAASRDQKRQKLEQQRQIEAMRKRWLDGFSRLRQMGKSPYFLPWYVIIGKSGAGKTKAITNSGMHFPLGDAKTAGVGGTRNCDWFFAEEAILLDTAGRLTTSEESSLDQKEWFAFLDLVRQYRRDMPINGLIVAVSADDLLKKDPHAVSEDARLVRQRVDELVQRFRVQFPIYVIVTKCDLVQGFSDFFRQVPSAHHMQMLGWTNPSFDMEDASRTIQSFFTDLRLRLSDLRAWLLKQDLDPVTQRNIYLFPEELKGLTDSLSTYCDTLFRETPYNESAFLRGVYFTSALQGEGTAVSAILERLGLAGSAADDDQSQSKSFFLQDFFEKRLREDDHLVVPTGSATIRTRLVNNFSLAAIVVGCVGFGLLSTGSYARNKRLLNHLQGEIERTQELVKASPEEQADRLGQLWTNLDQLRALVNHPDWLERIGRLGFLRGDRAIAIVEARFNEVYELVAFRPAMSAASAALTTQINVTDAVDALDALIGYVGDAKAAQQKDLENGGEALARWWHRNLIRSETMATNFASAYRYYLRDPWRSGDAERQRKAQEERGSQLAAIRESVPRLLTVEKIQDWLQSFGPPGRLPELSRPVSQPVTTAPAFTVAAWEKRVKPLVGKIDQVTPELNGFTTTPFVSAYATAYRGQWYNLVLALRPPDGNAASGLRQHYCSVGESPYFAGLKAIKEGVSVPFNNQPPPPWIGWIDFLLSKRDDYIGIVRSSACTSKVQDQNPCAALVGPADGPDGPRGRTQQLVAAVDDPTLRSSLERWMLYPFGTAFAEAKRECVRYQEEVADQMRAMLNGAKQPAELQQICAPRGDAAQLCEMSLAEIFDCNNARPRPGTKDVPISPALALALKDVKDCRNLLFDAVGNWRVHQIVFDSLLSSDIAGQLYVNETSITVRCGADPEWVLTHKNFQASKTLRWTPDCDDVELAVVVGSPSGAHPEQPKAKKFVGPFAVLEMLASAESLGGGQLQWEFTPPGVKTKFRVTVREEKLLPFYSNLQPH